MVQLFVLAVGCSGELPHQPPSSPSATPVAQLSATVAPPTGTNGGAPSSSVEATPAPDPVPPAKGTDGFIAAVRSLHPNDVEEAVLLGLRDDEGDGAGYRTHLVRRGQGGTVAVTTRPDVVVVPSLRGFTFIGASQVGPHAFVWFAEGWARAQAESARTRRVLGRMGDDTSRRQRVMFATSMAVCFDDDSFGGGVGALSYETKSFGGGALRVRDHVGELRLRQLRHDVLTEAHVDLSDVQRIDAEALTTPSKWGTRHFDVLSDVSLCLGRAAGETNLYATYMAPDMGWTRSAQATRRLLGVAPRSLAAGLTPFPLRYGDFVQAGTNVVDVLVSPQHTLAVVVTAEEMFVIDVVQQRLAHHASFERRVSRVVSAEWARGSDVAAWQTSMP